MQSPTNNWIRGRFAIGLLLALAGFGTMLWGITVPARSGNKAAPVYQDTSPPLDIAKASAVRDRYKAMIEKLPHVVGSGVGSSIQFKGRAAISVFVDRPLSTEEKRVFPAFLDGIPIEIIETGEFHAL